MTIRQQDHFQDVSRKNKILVFDDQNGNLNEAAGQEPLQMPNVQQHFWETLCGVAERQSSGWFELKTRIEEETVCRCEGRQLFEGRSPHQNNSDGGLLILANSAALVSESMDDSTVAAGNDQSCDDKNLKKTDGMPLITHKGDGKDGTHCERKGPRISQIRRLARLKGQSSVKQRIREDASMFQQGSTTRLTQIRHLARCRNHVVSVEKISDSVKQLQGVTNSSQTHCQALSKEVEEDTVVAKQHANQDSCQVENENKKLLVEVKGTIRLSQLRREARLRKAHFVAQK